MAAGQPRGGVAGTGPGFALRLVITGATGLPVSWVSTLEEFKLLKNPHFMWCCLAGAATILLFWWVTSYAVLRRFLPAPGWARTFLAE
ncbi:hypothetical protein ACFY2T_01715 [Streptomyces sp. NPDC001260]|uniref:hypothetical protein n=1 Tax=Streptomyces sp. NPDC001260 TaxID=3364551 RepID=UPI0036B99729